MYSILYSTLIMITKVLFQIQKKMTGYSVDNGNGKGSDVVITHYFERRRTEVLVSLFLTQMKYAINKNDVTSKFCAFSNTAK